MSINRDTKILEAILFASGSPVLEDDLKDKMIDKKNFQVLCVLSGNDYYDSKKNRNNIMLTVIVARIIAIIIVIESV